MKNRLFLFCLMAVMAVSCAKEQQETIQTITADQDFYATIENADTRVFADDQLRVLWNADDRVSIFNKTTYNRQYRFTGDNGANAGSFTKVPSDDFVTSNPLDYVYSVYPYNENTSISNDGEITVYLPAEQTYREDSFGLGANTMIAITEDDELMFKNLCGYFAVKLYGDNVAVKSITLKGNNNELLAGKGTVVAAIDAAPGLTMDATSATKELTLTCSTPVTIGTTAETATTFWFVVPPTTFDGGITLTVKDDENGVFEKTTSGTLEIKRNTLKNSAALKVIPGPSNDPIVFADANVKAKLVAAFDANNDGELSYAEAAAVISGDDLKNAFGSIKTYKSFDEFQFFVSVNSIPAKCFSRMTVLSSITLPKSIVSIGDYAFTDCSSLNSFFVPKSVTSIGTRAFEGCSSMTSFSFEEGTQITSLFGYGIYDIDGIRHYNEYWGMFANCSSLESFMIPASVSSIGYREFYNCSSLKEIVFEQGSMIANIPGNTWNSVGGFFSGCTGVEKIVLPESVVSIGYGAFAGCVNLKDINLHFEQLSSIPPSAFSGCRSLTGTLVLSNCQSIGSGAFSYSGFTSIALSDNCTTIGQSAFEFCNNLEAIKLSDAQTIIEQQCFRGCSSLKTIVFPLNLLSIGDAAFEESGLVSVSTPDTVTDIGQFAFYRCYSLRDVYLSSSIRSIGTSAFTSCNQLNSLTITAIIPPTAGCFLDFSNDSPIYVPNESIDAYKSAWSEYADRIQALPTVPVPEAVDLGLSVKWASFNLGASAPEEYGDYYAWGETEIDWDYNWANYKWCNGDYNKLTKYCPTNKADYWDGAGTPDGKTVLDLEDDAARANWGGTWRMPTDAEWTELRTNCTWTWTTQNGVNGRLVTASNGNSIFLPAAGYRYATSLDDVGSSGGYWSSSLYSDNPSGAWLVDFYSSNVGRSNLIRYVGLSVRPVCD